MGMDAPKNAQGREGWVTTRCPLAPWKHVKGYDAKPSFGISVKPDRKSGYHCFGCKSKGTLPGLAFKMSQYTDDDNYRQIGKETERIELLGMPDLEGWDEEYIVKIPKKALDHVY